MDDNIPLCPVLKATDIITRRWTPLVIRELLCGSHRFNDIHRSVPKMSRSLLTRRLSDLERAGVVERTLAGEDAHPEYHLTPAGEELRPIIEQLGAWGERWVRHEISRDDLDAGRLMWEVRQGIEPDRLPPGRLIVQFGFEDAPAEHRNFWLVMENGAVDLCTRDPGYDYDLRVDTDVLTMTKMWVGDIAFGQALRDGIVRVRGRREHRRAFPGWLGLRPFQREHSCRRPPARDAIAS